MVDGWEHGCRHYLNALMRFAVQFALGRFSSCRVRTILWPNSKPSPITATIAAEIFLQPLKRGSVAKVSNDELQALETLCLRSLQHWRSRDDPVPSTNIVRAHQACVWKSGLALAYGRSADA